MKEEIAIELLKLSTSLTRASMEQNNYFTTNQRSAAHKQGTIETIFDDCTKAVLAHYHDLVMSSK